MHDLIVIGGGIQGAAVAQVASAAGLKVLVLEQFAAPPSGIYAVFPQRKHLPLRVRLWIDFLKHHYGRPGYWQA